ncbi:MAG: MucR family transcriptional regulator [Desulfobaccales bacterium]|jgi:predicted transcriptional regulator
MATEILKLTTEIIVSHASLTELSTQQLLGEIKMVYGVLSSLEGGVAPEIIAPKKSPKAKVVKKPPIPLKEIVKDKYVVCLECGRKMKSLKMHLQKVHGLIPKEYFWKFDLDPQKYPLVCKEYSDQRRKLALKKGLGVKGTRRKAGTPD